VQARSSAGSGAASFAAACTSKTKEKNETISFARHRTLKYNSCASTEKPVHHRKHL
jgi:hypothetical protein